jgi:hypothetical protein
MVNPESAARLVQLPGDRNIAPEEPCKHPSAKIGTSTASAVFSMYGDAKVGILPHNANNAKWADCPGPTDYAAHTGCTGCTACLSENRDASVAVCLAANPDACQAVVLAMNTTATSLKRPGPP